MLLPSMSFVRLRRVGDQDDGQNCSKEPSPGAKNSSYKGEEERRCRYRYPQMEEHFHAFQDVFLSEVLPRNAYSDAKRPMDRVEAHSHHEAPQSL